METKYYIKYTDNGQKVAGYFSTLEEAQYAKDINWLGDKYIIMEEQSEDLV